jgi:NADPH-dependent glutamate synthase beta subunit-like oxidoreductase
MSESNVPYLVAVVGAGPAGLYAARQIALGGAEVVLLNRDIKPGGLAEYGIYYDNSARFWILTRLNIMVM